MSYTLYYFLHKVAHGAHGAHGAQSYQPQWSGCHPLLRALLPIIERSLLMGQQENPCHVKWYACYSRGENEEVELIQ